MRLLILTQHYVPDVCSTGYLCSTVAEHRAALGDDVTVLTSRGGYVQRVGPADRNGEELNGVRVRRVWSTHFGRGGLLRRSIDLLTFCLSVTWRAAWMPAQDVILSVTTPPLMVWAAVVHRLFHPRAKIALWSMDCYPEVAERAGVIAEGGVISRIWKAVNRALYRRLARVVCLDEAMARLLTQYRRPGSAVELVVIPNWERAGVFAPEALPPPWPGARELPLAGKLVVLYMGNAGYGHEFNTVLEAAAQLRSDPVAFLFVGGGRRWKELEAAKQSGQLDNVLLLGYLNLPKEQTPALMRCADCALVTLRDEMLGVMSPSKLHSSLATSLAIIYVGPKGSNVDTAIDQFDCGVRVACGDTRALVAGLRALVAAPDRLAALKRNAREAFEMAYCDVRTLPQFDRLFERLLGEGERVGAEFADGRQQSAPV